jgi:hypothetical protein
MSLNAVWTVKKLSMGSVGRGRTANRYGDTSASSIAVWQEDLATTNVGYYD